MEVVVAVIGGKTHHIGAGLQGHAPLVSGLVRGEIVYAADGREERVGIVGGFVKVCRDEVEACVEIDAAKN